MRWTWDGMVADLQFLDVWVMQFCCDRIVARLEGNNQRQIRMGRWVR
jgi:hypothetical protein